MRLLLQVNRVIAVLQIVPEMRQRPHLLQDVLHNLLMPLHNLPERIHRERLPRLQLQELPERQSAQVVHVHHPLQIRVRVDTHNRGSGKDNLQIRERIVARPQLPVPPRILMHLVQQQHLPAQLVEMLHGMEQPVIRDEQVVHVHIQARPVLRMVRPRVVQQECRLPHPPASLHRNQAALAVDFIHQPAPDERGALIQQSPVCRLQTVHPLCFCHAKVKGFFINCKLRMTILCQNCYSKL